MLRQIWGIGLLAVVMSGSVAHAQPTDEQVISLTAVMNEMALACGDVSAQEMQALRVKQRANRPNSLSEAEYEKAYAKAREKFLGRWKAVSAADKKNTCAQLKKQSEQGMSATALN